MGPGGLWRTLPGEGFAGYTLRVAVAPLPVPTDSIARTEAVSGSLRISRGRIVSARITADMRQLESPDRYLTFQTQGPQTNLFPRASFRLLAPVAFTGRRGQVVNLIAPGALSLHGITRKVDFPLRARWNGDSLQVAGRLGIKRSDFDLRVLGESSMRLDEQATIETSLEFHRPGDREPKPTRPLPGAPSTATSTEPAAPQERPATGTDEVAVEQWRTDRAGSNLVLTSLGGSHIRRLTTPPRTRSLHMSAHHPSWSPDGTRLVFVREIVSEETETGGSVDLYIVRADGRGLDRLTRLRDLAPADPSWSPDGRWIAFTGWGPDGAAIYRVASDGSRLGRLTEDSRVPDYEPAWSPDGRRIAYVSFTAGANEDLFVMNADGSRPRRLTAGPSYDSAPAWSPDGRRIAFGRDGDVFVTRPNGTGLRRLSRGPALDASPGWSSDGRRLVFTRADATGTAFPAHLRVVVMNADGSRIRRIPLGADALAPAWRPR